MTRLVGVAAAVVMLTAAGCSSDASPASSPPSAVEAGASALATGGGAPGFSSAQYGYTATVPAGWAVEPATSQWDGVDIDHTSNYADRFDGAGSGFIFTIGTPTDDSVQEFADAHVAWVEANRGCKRASEPVDSALDGAPAVRVALRCPAGIYGATLVSKAVTIHDGLGVIVTAFSPDAGNETFPPFDELLASLRWAAP